MTSLRDLRNTSGDDVLEALGLTRTRNISGLENAALPMLGMLSLGALVGFGIGLLVAPKPGTELRQQVRSQLHDARSRVEDSVG